MAELQEGVMKQQKIEEISVPRSCILPDLNRYILFSVTCASTAQSPDTKLHLVHNLCSLPFTLMPRMTVFLFCGINTYFIKSLETHWN